MIGSILEWLGLLKGIIGLLEKLGFTKFLQKVFKSLKPHNRKPLFWIIWVLIWVLILILILALQNFFNDEKSDLILKDEKGDIIEHCKSLYKSKYNNFEEVKKVLRSEAKSNEAQKFFDNNIRDRISNYTPEKEKQILNILERYVVLEKEDYDNSPHELGDSCIYFKPSNKLKDKVKPRNFQKRYCPLDRTAPLPIIQKEKENKIITELRDYEPLLEQLAEKKILSLLLEKPIFEEDLKGRKHCGLLKFSILPIQLQAILIEDEFNTISEVKGVDENDNQG
ncbi:MAG: hypothetical protein F6K24_38010, partial [Okeania sp. SIO2D1]|nr:hypothetical protein [Okeania sp. SIO2D1]